MATPSQKQAQLATYLGNPNDDSCPEQLFSFSASALAGSLNANGSLAGANIPDRETYPYIEDGERSCSLDISQKRTSIWDTTCVWRFTIDQAPNEHNSKQKTPWIFHVDSKTKLAVTRPVVVTVTGILQPMFQADPGSLSKRIDLAQYSLNENTLNDEYCLAWLLQIRPMHIENDADDEYASIHGLINDCFAAFFQQGSASLLVPTFISKDDVLSYGREGCEDKLGIAVASCMDADKKDLSNKVYVVLQTLADDGKVDRSHPTAPWVQQWCLPGSNLNCTGVIRAFDAWVAIMEALEEPVENSLMDGLVAGWPADKQKREFTPLFFGGKKGDFNWVPGKITSTDLTKNSIPCCTSSALCHNEQYPQVEHEIVWDGVQRTVENRLYFAPGYVDKDAGNIGPQLPMQSMYETHATKWQMAFMGKNTFDAGTSDTDSQGRNFTWSATLEAWWLIFFNVREFLFNEAALDSSLVYFEMNYLKNGPNDNAALDGEMVRAINDYNAWLTDIKFQQSLKTAIDVNINITTACPVGDSQCFFNNNGDLVILFECANSDFDSS